MRRSDWLTVVWISAFVFPLFFVLVMGVTTDWVFPKIWGEFSWNAWKMALFTGNLGTSILLSLTISGTVALLSTASAFVTSRYIAYLNDANKWLLLAYLPFALSPIIYAVCILFYFNFFNISGTWVGVMIAQFFILYPYGVIVCAGFWNERIRQLEDLTKTLGGHRWQRWKMVLWPLGNQILAICFFQSFLISWFDYGMVQFIGVGQVKTLTMHVYAYVNEASPYFAAVASSLLILPPLIFLMVNKRLVFRKEWT